MRDKEATRRRILEAVGRLLAKGAFRDIGVNAVAREAGVDKVLIYRYFGGLHELLDAYAESASFWPSTERLLQGAPESVATPDEAAELSIAIMRNHMQALRDMPVTQDIMREELIEANELTDKLARSRERQGIRLLESMKDAVDAEWDVPAFGALLHAGISYLILRSKTASDYMGIDLRTEDGWRRLCDAIEPAVRGYWKWHRERQ
jgi:AcrR family transcriptional regulator